VKVNREELVALRDIIDLALRLPADVRIQVAAWLAPEAAPRPGNGLDHDAPLIASTPRPTHAAKPARAPAGERRLLAAMESNPGASANALAKAAGSARATVGDQLRRLNAQGLIEQDAGGRWRLAGDGARPIQPSP
jgi:hypothetical protein